MYALGIVGESYTLLMAKRFNISIPDALAERLEPHKDRISLSAVMQAALERELAQLNLSDEDKQRRASLKAVATHAWLQRNPCIGKALGAFIDYLLDSAINDSRIDLFFYYRRLCLSYRKSELTKRILDNPRKYGDFGLITATPEERERIVAKALSYAHETSCPWGGHEEFASAFNAFLCGELTNKVALLPDHMYEEIDEKSGRFRTHDDIWGLLYSQGFGELSLKLIDERLSPYLDESDIDSLVLDFESAFLELEFDNSEDE